MSDKCNIRIDWATHEAAKYAVETWHYSKALPVPPLVKIGAWENGKYIGCVIFSRGANNNLLKPFNLLKTEGCELTRVALSRHKTEVSKVLKHAMLFLKRNSPGMRLIVSFADPSEGHHGGIYQAGNWIYTGVQPDSIEYIGPDGKKWHGRMVKKQGWTTCHGKRRKTFTPDQCIAVKKLGKHRYLMPLDKEMKKQVSLLSKPYPKKSSVVSSKIEHLPNQEEEGGVVPTTTLHFNNQKIVDSTHEVAKNASE